MFCAYQFSFILTVFAVFLGTFSLAAPLDLLCTSALNVLRTEEDQRRWGSSTVSL